MIALSMPVPIRAREQMLGGRDQHALLHQAGRIADARYVPAQRFDFEIVEVGTPETNSRASRSRKNSQLHGRSAVQAHTLAFHGGTNCLFRLQGGVGLLTT